MAAASAAIADFSRYSKPPPLGGGVFTYADKAYNDYVMEDVLREASHIQLYPIRKKSSTRTLPP